MEILEEISRDMELPNFYAPIHDQIRNHLARLGLGSRLNAIPSGVIFEMPALIDQTTANQKSFKVRATRKLRQSRVFLDMAAKADDEIKPILLYYGIAQLWGFFVSSCVKHGSLSQSHGLKVLEGPQLQIKFSGRGSFFRLVNLFSIFGISSQYSIIDWDPAKSKFIQKPISCPYTIDIGAFKKIFGEDLAKDGSRFGNTEVDLDCYVALFVASHLARYRPELWTEIVDGEDSDSSMVIYRRAFEKCSTTTMRVVGVLWGLSKGISPSSAFTSLSYNLTTLGELGQDSVL
ncbi:MAG: hypothetical protein ABSG57_13830 [Candidatus Bathyarchaeia archaeon]|jgi:hypothetical protein